MSYPSPSPRACSHRTQPEKTHPADWENPGRVKVQFEKDGRFLNPIVTNRTQLCAELAKQMQRANPALVPQPEAPREKAAPAAAAPTPAPGGAKGKKKSKGKAPGGGAAAPASAPAPAPRLPTKAPRPPLPLPARDERLPIHSPAAPTGVAVAAIKRDLENEKEAKKKGLPFAGGDDGAAKDKMPKMKRVVVRGSRR